jgi:radical SAM protein with 4Fe4S-binding SPASM domain
MSETPQKDFTKYHLSPDLILRRLEAPSLYNVKKDELYELNERGFSFILECAGEDGCFTEDREFLRFCIDEGILRKERGERRQETIRQSPVPSLRYLELLLTERCNLRCRHCYIGESGGKELPLELVLKGLDEFERIQGLRVLISGGEPLIYSDFEGLNEYLRTYPLRKVLLTNGILLTEKRLKDLSVDEIQISIDGIGEGHEVIRGKGTYEKTLSALKRTVDAGFDVSVSTMIHPGNLDQFDEMKRLFESLGVREWTVDVPCLSGRLSENRELCLPPEEAGKFMRYGYGGGFHGGGEGYGCGLHLVSLLPDGHLAKCAFYEESPLGHMDEGLEVCWQRLKPVRLDTLECDCPFLEQCRGGCRYRAELLGNPSGKDWYRCHAFED